MLLGQALLDAFDRRDLGRTEWRLVERREILDLGSPRRPVRVGLGIADLLGQGRWGREVEDPASPRMRVIAVGEVGLGAAGLEDEGQPAVNGDRLQLRLRRQTVGVDGGLPLDAAEGRAFGFGLDHTDDLAVDVEEVVDASVPGLHDDLAAGDTLVSDQV